MPLTPKLVQLSLGSALHFGLYSMLVRYARCCNVQFAVCLAYSPHPVAGGQVHSNVPFGPVFLEPRTIQYLDSSRQRQYDSMSFTRCASLRERSAGISLAPLFP